MTAKTFRVGLLSSSKTMSLFHIQSQRGEEEVGVAIWETAILMSLTTPFAARIAELEAALATARRDAMEEAARIAENEPEPEGEPPIELHGRSVKNIAISSVSATKHSIAAAIHAALERGK